MDECDRSRRCFVCDAWCGMDGCNKGLAELQHLKKLVILNVAENQVARIPVEVLRNLRTLKALVLNNNSITTLEWIPKFPVRACGALEDTLSLFPMDVRFTFPMARTLAFYMHVHILQELNSLIISNNRVSQFPARTMDRLPSLTKISM